MRALLGAGAVLLLAAGCGGTSSPKEVGMEGTTSITVTSTAFAEGEPVPTTYTCEGADLAPPLAWTGVPDDAAALALVVDDPDAPHGMFTHWVVLDIPASVGGSTEGGVPSGGVQARNSAGRSAWMGPCPPSGTHHYRFTLYALSARTGLAEGASLDEALRAVQRLATASGRLTGTYRR
ncbi:MAG: YbhB/YbcL family Raf kinase inhibitor-like protein [Nocardioidaceae bacterium]|nr:YbhB/YbcL family Raf kinase inhibitor-like protein [Nocardioidaceae bacterium]